MDAPPTSPALSGDAYEVFWDCIDECDDVAAPEEGARALDADNDHAYERFWELMDAE